MQTQVAGDIDISHYLEPRKRIRYLMDMWKRKFSCKITKMQANDTLNYNKVYH